MQFRAFPIQMGPANGANSSKIADQVRLLDGLVRYRFGNNVELMGAWASARKVAGPFKSRPEREVGAGEAMTLVG